MPNIFAVKLIQEGRGINKNFLNMALFPSEKHLYKIMQVSPDHVVNLLRSSVGASSRGVLRSENTTRENLFLFLKPGFTL